MKTWQKIISFALAIFLFGALTFFLTTKQKECCLCNSFRYHAPCLFDLKTGDMIELDLYFPHETKVAELSDPQPDMGTFSFVRLGNIMGTKLTDSKIIDIHIPRDKSLSHSLCHNCRKQLPFGFTNRYVFADLYGMEEKILIPIEADTNFTLRCYEIATHTDIEKGGISVIIHGTLEK